MGAGARVRNAIVDKEVRVPSGFQLGIDPVMDSRRFYVSPRGIAVVPKAMDLSTCKGQAPVSKTEGRFSANGRSALADSWKSQSATLPVP